MDTFETQLRQLKKAEPSRRFLRDSKKRLLNSIEFNAHETWFLGLIRRAGSILPPPAFRAMARMRLMEHIAFKQPVAGRWMFFRRLAASALIMILAVTSTLFFVDGRQIASAAENTYVQVLGNNVTVKRADRLMWDEVGITTELSAGDLIQVGTDSTAIVHFFDDTQLRLAENSLLLISHMEVSPAFARQGLIEVSLQEGRAWVQTLNVDDAFSAFVLSTRDASIHALNGVFDVSVSLNHPTNVQVFSKRAAVHLLDADTQALQAPVTVAAGHQFGWAGHSFRDRALEVADHADGWVQRNLQRDHDYLAVLREREFERIRLSAGVLPGQMFYPIKLVKERLKLAFSFDKDHLTEAQIDIANKRLEEAIVLLEQGNDQKANEALMAYKGLARPILEVAQNNPTIRNEVSNRILAGHKKVLVTALPTDAPVPFLTEALNETEELIAETPLDREQVRLGNSVERLNHIQELVTAGDFAKVKELLTRYQLAPSSVLEELALLEDSPRRTDILEQVLTLRQQEATLLNLIATRLGGSTQSDDSLLTMVTRAHDEAEIMVSETIAFIQPLAPELVTPAVPVADSRPDSKVQYFVDKMDIYKTWQGQKNQMSRLLEDYRNPKDIEFLRQVRPHLSARAQNTLNIHILNLQRKNRLYKHKAVERKIERSQRLR